MRNDTQIGGQDADESEFDLREYIALLREHRWLILGITLAVSLGGLFWTLRAPKIYSASCTIEYDPNPSRPLGNAVEDVADPIGNFWATREFFQTQNRVIGSRDVAARAVQKLGLNKDPSFVSQSSDDTDTSVEHSVEQAAIALQGRVTVEPIPETRLVKISARDVKPERARAIADAVAQAYIDKTMEDRLSSTVKAIDWLGTQLGSLRTELDGAELALHDFKKDHNVLSVSMEDRQNLVAADLETLNAKLTEAHASRIESAARYQRLKTGLQKDVEQIDPTLFETNPSLQQLAADLRTKRKERDALATKYGREHPDMKAINEEIASLDRQLLREKQAIIRSAEGDLRQVTAVEEGLRSAANHAQSEGLDLNLREIEYRKLNRDRDNKEKLFEVVLQRLTETDLTRMLKITHVRILDPALLPTTPVSPNLLKNLGTSLIAGLVLGLLAVLVVTRLDRTVRSADAVESLGFQVLGVIPHLYEDDPPRRLKVADDDTEPPPLVHDLIVHDRPTSSAAETFRMVRTNLAFMSPDKPMRSLVVTSALPREGKTTVSTNLAISFAKFGCNVVLVDTDLRRPRIHRTFGLSKDVGISSVVVGNKPLDEAILPTQVDGLSIITSGPIPPNPAELLHSPAFGRLVLDLQKRFDWVIFDSPPMGAVADSAILAPQADGVLLVVRAGATTRDSIVGARRQLRSVQANIIGSVLNDIDTRAKSYRYGGYYYDYRYGDYEPLPNDTDSDADAA
ncbi:MAG: polysaccharide biosynthesis tyrosine autokinase [Polyangiales bacterium]